MSVRCASCGYLHSADEWSAKPTLRTLTANDVRAYVVAWPQRIAVDVRECSGCERRLARLRAPLTAVRHAS
jgi:hypothetical protein